MQTNSSNPISGLILAGGQGTRMGGVDKGLVKFKGKTLAEHQIALFQSLGLPVYISCNRNQEYYSTLTGNIVEDHAFKSGGPLSGIYETLNNLALHQQQGLLLVVPVDAPLITSSILKELSKPLLEPDTKIQATMAHDGQRLQPLICCLKVSVREQLKTYLSSGERKTQQWLKSLPHQIIHFDQVMSAFENINDESTLRKLSEE